MIVQTETENDSSAWKKFLKKHWTMFGLLEVAAILATAGSVYVFLWFVGDAQSTGMVPSTLGFWTMGNMVTFILHVIFWELLLIGVPVILGVVAGWLWWRRLPGDEKKEYNFFGKRSRTTNGGDGISLLFFIAFCFKVFIDGNWNLTISKLDI